VEWKDFKQQFEKRLNLQDPNYLEIIFATALAHRLHGDPLWLFWVAQSGGGKTEVLRTFRDVPDVKYIESMSEKALVSHFHSKEDKSLIKQLDNKCLIIKDFTGIMSMRQEIQNAIFGQFRGAYDGEYDTATGLGEKGYKIKFGVLAGVTPEIWKRRTVHTALGERFLFLQTMPDKETRQKRVRAAMKYSVNQKRVRKELRSLTAEMMNSIPMEFEKMKLKLMIGKDQHEWFIRMAEILAQLRAHVPRDGYHKEIIDEPIIELGTRIVGQIMRLFQALRLLVDKDDALRATARVVKDSIPSVRAKMVEQAMKKNGFRVDEFDSKISEEVLRRHAEDLVALEVFGKSKLPSGEMVYKLDEGLVEDAQGLFGGESVLRKQRPGMWE